ncbi:MAG TPA: HypC/HybG/HupF family hydrogenase formation chaperone [Acidimicrobiales bacterium]|nr:HypC/HybG/HupF family hydrogenase formation chaperone [Acidimicrobiales bacterium]
MCLSLAGRIGRIEGEHALVQVDGRDRRVSLALLLLEGEPVAPGDWVLVHTGFAVARLDPAEGAEIARMRRDMETIEEEDP